MNLKQMLRAVAGEGGPVIRGRVSKVSVLPRGVVSVVVHFGIDEPGAKDIVPDTLFEGRIIEPPKEKPRG